MEATRLSQKTVTMGTFPSEAFLKQCYRCWRIHCPWSQQAFPESWNVWLQPRGLSNLAARVLNTSIFWGCRLMTQGIGGGWDAMMPWGPTEHANPMPHCFPCSWSAQQKTLKGYKQLERGYRGCHPYIGNCLSHQNWEVVKDTVSHPSKQDKSHPPTGALLFGQPPKHLRPVSPSLSTEPCEPEPSPLLYSHEEDTTYLLQYKQRGSGRKQMVLWEQLQEISFLFKIDIFLAMLGFCCCTQAFSSCGVGVSHWGGFSCCRAQALGTRVSVVAAFRLSSCDLLALGAQASGVAVQGLSSCSSRL